MLSSLQVGHEAFEENASGGFPNDSGFGEGFNPFDIFSSFNGDVIPFFLGFYLSCSTQKNVVYYLDSLQSFFSFKWKWLTYQHSNVLHVNSFKNQLFGMFRKDIGGHDVKVLRFAYFPRDHFLLQN